MDSISFKELGRFFKEKRLACGLTQAELGKKLGYSGQFVANWERGASSTPATAIAKMAKILKIEEGELLERLSVVSTDYWKRAIRRRRRAA